MRKVMIGLLLAAMTFGLLACGEQKAPETNQPEEDETIVYKTFEDPRGKTLESTATGEGEIKLVETKYETEDVVIADYIPTELGYAVDPTGKTDSTAGLQQALFDCYKQGGGTVYLPEGNYAISDTIYVPPYVTLRGDWQDPDVEAFDGAYGTIISVWMESEDSETAGAFKLGGSGGVVGLTVYYPLQSMECIMPYPYTFYVDGVGPNYMLSTIHNVTIINGYRGIGTPYENAHEQLTLDNIKGTFLANGVNISNSADVGTVKNITISNRYWKNASADCMNAAPAKLLDNYTKKYATGMKLGDLEWTNFSNISIEGCAIGINTVSGERIQFAGSMIDLSITDCAQGFVVDGMDERWGTVIARSSIEGGIVNYAEGKIKVTDVEISGDVTGIKEDSLIKEDEVDLSGYSIDYYRSYVKPQAKLVVADLPNGLFSDAAPKLQEALDEAGEAGGGVVYVPAGLYRMHTALKVPAGVELRGSSSVATRDQAGCSAGTVFYCYYGDDASNGAEDVAFITLTGENAGINGVRIIYPENGPKSSDINSTYAVRGNAKGVYAVNCAIAGAAYGVDFTGCDNHYISRVMTTCYYNAFRLGGTGGFMTACLQNGTILCRVSSVGLSDWVTDLDAFEFLLNPILRQKCTCIILEGAKDEVIYNSFAYGVKTFLSNNGAENTLAVNLGTDNLETSSPQIRVEGGSLSVINMMRFNGYSYDLESGSLAMYNRIAINEVGERNISKSK